MANRSYLYTIELDRSQNERQEGQKIMGISEYAYAIPLAYKILVSCNAKISKSILWGYEYPIAIIGDFTKGKEKLYDFLNKLYAHDLFNKNKLKKRILETKQFLDIQNLEFIILEGGEIFEMNEEKIEIQNKKLFEQEIKTIDQHIKEILDEFSEMKKSIDVLQAEVNKLKNPKGFFKKLFSFNNSKHIALKEKEINNIEQKMWYELGIDNWSKVLYYHFDNK